MSDVVNAISKLRESLELLVEDSVSELTDAQIVECADAMIGDLEVENSLYAIALDNGITGAEFERWSELVQTKLAELDEGEELSDQDLLNFVKEIRN